MDEVFSSFQGRVRTAALERDQLEAALEAARADLIAKTEEAASSAAAVRELQVWLGQVLVILDLVFRVN